MEIGKRIQQLRITKGLKSPYALAKAAGVPVSVVYDLEAGKTKSPRTDTMQAIAAALGVPVKDLHDDIEVNTDTADNPSYDWVWRSRFASLNPGRIWEMRNEPVENRVRWALAELLNILPIEEIAEHLSTTPGHITAIMQNRDGISPMMVDLLEKRFSVPGGWLVGGHPPRTDETLRKILQHPDGGTYLLVILQAIDDEILPELLMGQLNLWRSAMKNKPPTR